MEHNMCGPVMNFIYKTFGNAVSKDKVLAFQTAWAIKPSALHGMEKQKFTILVFDNREFAIENPRTGKAKGITRWESPFRSALFSGHHRHPKN